MSEARWSAVDAYIADVVVRPAAALEAALRDSEAAGLPAIAVSPAYGKLLMLLARACRARRVLEIGTLGGYSTIWLAAGIPPDGRVVTLELEPKHAAIARVNLDRAGVGERVDIRIGPAATTLQALGAGGAEPFDLVFIDADKEGYPIYLELVIPLCRAGALIVADNVVRDGRVADADSTDPQVIGIRKFNAMLADDPRFDATIIQTVGIKKYDGFALAVVA